jgi:hypothetical protein
VSTLLIVQSHKEAQEQLFRNWPHLKLPGWNVLGICPENSVHEWPDDVAHTLTIGKAKEVGHELCPNLVERWLRTWEYVLNDEKFENYSDFAMTEADSIFTKKPPSHPGGMFTHLAGGSMEGFKCSRYYHPIWWADREAARIVTEEGRKLWTEVEFEHGSPDCFLGLIADRRTDLVIHETGNFSVNGEDFKNRRDSAEKDIPNTFFVHGFRTDEELRWILAISPNVQVNHVPA